MARRCLRIERRRSYLERPETPDYCSKWGRARR
jgi:hypothetical protein